MLKLSDNFGVRKSTFTISCFYVTASSLRELQDFWSQNSRSLDRPLLHEEEKVTLTLLFKEAQRTQVENLVYRFNILQAGERLQLDKKEYLEQAANEAVKAIVYATDYCPNGMDINQYVGAVLYAYSEYGDSILFDQKIINLANPRTGVQMETVGRQIELFKHLLTVPLANEFDDIPPEEEDAEVTLRA